MSFKNLNHPILTACVILFTLCATHMEAQCPKIVWSDEFDGTTLDQTKWSYQMGDGCDINLCQWGNSELQWYSQNNVAVSSGTLKIVAKKETIQSRSYTSGRIRTLNKGDIKFGRIEARMKLPIGKGIWPAFWMLPTDNVYGGWPQSGEIDIMENVGHEPSNISGTIHYGNPAPNNSYSTKTFTLTEGDFTESFHNYALEWSENDIKWFIDGYLYATKTRSDVGGLRWPFDQKFHLLLNLAVGGNLPGSPNSSTVFPQTYEIDYVRVYDLLDAAYLKGGQKVAFMAKNSAYSIANFPTGSTIAWTVPTGATIVSGNATKDLVVNWGTIGGKITATVTSPCGETKHELIVQVEPNMTTAVILENFDAEGKITLTSKTGEFTDNFATPSPNAINKSALCGKYIRNASQLFDILVYNIADVPNGLEFTTSEKKFYIDINSNAPIGTTILLQLEDKNVAKGTNYPTGRHSRYTAITTKQNEWERLSFAFTDRPDANLSSFSINQLILLFATNTNSGSTYYFDNFEIYAKPTTPTVDIASLYAVQLSPNPVSESLTLTVDKDKMIEHIEVFDVLGKRVLQQNNITHAERHINVQGLKAGLYYLTVLFKDSKRVSKAFVKE